MKVFSVYDSKAEAYLPPWVAQTTAVALRRFEATAQDSNSDFSRFAGDYTIFEIGEWDEDGGSIVMYEAKHNLGTALQFSQKPINGERHGQE